MKKLLFESRKLQFLYSLLIFQILLYSIYRLGFLAYFNNDLSPGTLSAIFQSFLLGFRFDVRLAMFLMIPAMVIVNLPMKTLIKVKISNWLYTIIFAIVNLLYVTDIGYYDYLKSRLNSTVISFFKNPIISFEMVRESYPWFLILLLIIFLSVITSFIVRKKVTTKLIRQSFIRPQKRNIIGGIFFFFLFAFGLYGSVKMYPLRWSEAFSQTDSFASN
jgi:hypothetical protein